MEIGVTVTIIIGYSIGLVSLPLLLIILIIIKIVTKIINRIEEENILHNLPSLNLFDFLHSFL